MPHRSFLAAIFCALMVTSASAANVYPIPPKAERGIASFYGHGDGFALRRTFCGQIMQPMAMTAAHPSLPCGTRVLVLVPEKNGGRSVVVTVTDRGPAKSTGRVIDLSYGAAKKLGIVGVGTAKVLLRVLH